MFKRLLSKKGISMIEVLIAMMLTIVAAVSLSSMIPLSWQTVGKSDLIGRAAGIMQNELEWREYLTMRGITPLDAAYPAAVRSVSVDGATFTVTTTASPSATFANTWVVNVNVTWPGNNKGISSSVIVTRQDGFNNLDNS